MPTIWLPHSLCRLRPARPERASARFGRSRSARHDDRGVLGRGRSGPVPASGGPEALPWRRAPNPCSATLNGVPPKRNATFRTKSPSAARRSTKPRRSSIGSAPTGRLHEALIRAIDITAGEVFWREKVQPSLTSGRRPLWIARIGDKIAGRLHLDCDTPPNQSHRAEVAKLMVHPDFRRIGIALKLMETLETRPREESNVADI